MLRESDGTVRYYTIREMARLQTFPDRWIFEGKWNAVTRQLGNAVPVTLGQVVAEAIASSLRSVRIDSSNLLFGSATEGSRSSHYQPHDGGSQKQGL